MSCLDYFYRLLARREYSAYELQKKALGKGFDQNDITEAINQLQEKGYQSDIRLVESLITSFKGKYGKSVIKRKAREKGIDADIFEPIWMEYVEQNESQDDGELDELKAKVMRKYKIENFHHIEPKTKAKVWNYLQYRGFNPSDLLEQWQREQDENQ